MCVVYIYVGQIRPCNDKFGWGYVDNFLATSSNILAVPQPPFEHVSVAGSDEHQHVGSRINCAVDIKNSLACGFHNVLVDFEKAPIVGRFSALLLGWVFEVLTIVLICLQESTGNFGRGLSLRLENRLRVQRTSLKYQDTYCNLYMIVHFPVIRD